MARPCRGADPGAALVLADPPGQPARGAEPSPSPGAVSLRLQDLPHAPPGPPAQPAQLAASPSYRLNFACESTARVDTDVAHGIDQCAEQCTEATCCTGFLYNDSLYNDSQRAQGACQLFAVRNASAAAVPRAAPGAWTYCRHACETFQDAPACDGVSHCAWQYKRKRLPSMCVERTPQAPPAALMEHLAIPTVALLLGIPAYKSMAGKLLINFGGQALMNLCAKSILSEQIVSESGPRLEGIPAPFLLTGMQQGIAMLIFACMIALGRAGRSWYVPKPLTSWRQVRRICVFGCAFGMNMTFNILCMALLPLSANLTIRSCLPLFVYVMQQGYNKFVEHEPLECNMMEVVTMVVGVACACMVVVASGSVVDDRSSSFWVGVLCGILSLFSGAVNLVLAGVLGGQGMNSIDSAGYSSLPVFLLCLFPFLFLRHPVNHWYTVEGFPDTQARTDLNILRVAMDRGPHMFLALFALCPLTFAYNISQIWLVQKMSATHMSFAGNVNKAATITLAMVIGWERFPSGPLVAGGRFVGWDWLKAAGILGNFASFAAYSHFQEVSRAWKEGADAAPEASAHIVNSEGHSCSFLHHACQETEAELEVGQTELVKAKAGPR